MRWEMRVILLAAAAAALAAAPSLAQRPREGDLKPGDPAPAITLKDLAGDNAVSLPGLRGRPAVLIFGSCT